MSFLSEDDIRVYERPPKKAKLHAFAEEILNIKASPTKQFVPYNMPLTFGSDNSRFQAPPFVTSSGPSSSVLNSLPPSPKNNDVKMHPMSESAITPSTTPTSTPLATNIFSRSPSMSSVSSIRSRSPFASLPPLKIPSSNAPLPTPVNNYTTYCPNCNHLFAPQAAANASAASRSAMEANMPASHALQLAEDPELRRKFDEIAVFVADAIAERDYFKGKMEDFKAKMENLEAQLQAQNNEFQKPMEATGADENLHTDETT